MCESVRQKLGHTNVLFQSGEVNYDHQIIISSPHKTNDKYLLLVTSMEYPDLFHEKMCTLKKAQQHDGSR